MIKIENVTITSHEQMVSIARGMRNSYNSWNKMDTDMIMTEGTFGPKDLELARRLVRSGSDSEAKFLRMIPVYFDLTAPLYFWKQFDTFKVGTIRNSCSTMHRITAKEFTEDDFSMSEKEVPFGVDNIALDDGDLFIDCLDGLNAARDLYLKEKDIKTKKEYWNYLIKMLPESYNQRSTIFLNYAVLRNMYFQRRNHKLSEWHEFCTWIKTLPMAEDLITLEPLKKSPIDYVNTLNKDERTILWNYLIETETKAH